MYCISHYILANQNRPGDDVSCFMEKEDISGPFWGFFWDVTFVQMII